MEATIINYDRVVADPTVLAVVKVTAYTLMNNPYLSLQSFFTNLTDIDLATLHSAVESQSAESLKNLILLSEMLCRAEGSYREGGDDESFRNVTALCGFIVCASLGRKGAVEVFLENMSFDPDLDNKVIVREKD